MNASSSRKSFLLLGLLAVLAGGAFLSLYGFKPAPRKEEVASLSTTATAASGFSKAVATGPLAALLVHTPRKAVADFAFSNEKGENLGLAKWKGRVVLVNLWATWCAPCRKEMPDLNNLQKALGGADFEVVAISLDRKGLEASKAFLAETNASSLHVYVEPDGKALAAVQALGLPASLLIDRNGMEAARLLGPANWASPEAQLAVKALMDEKQTPPQ